MNGGRVRDEWWEGEGWMVRSVRGGGIEFLYTYKQIYRT